MKKHRIRFLRKCDIRIAGALRSLKRDEEIEVSEEEGQDLIRRGLAVPGGEQHGPAVRMND
jgi:hypothetical protein